jgi:hypothetical protein
MYIVRFAIWFCFWIQMRQKVSMQATLYFRFSWSRTKFVENHSDQGCNSSSCLGLDSRCERVFSIPQSPYWLCGVLSLQAVATWSWPLTSTQCWRQKMVELYLSSSICLHVMRLNWISIRTTLHLPFNYKMTALCSTVFVLIHDPAYKFWYFLCRRRRIPC